MIKVTVGEQKTQSVKPFPKLMMVRHDLSNGYKNKGMIVFFKKHGEGTVICNGEKHIDGYHSENWVMDSFTDYNEPITLQNA